MDNEVHNSNSVILEAEDFMGIHSQQLKEKIREWSRGAPANTFNSKWTIPSDLPRLPAAVVIDMLASPSGWYRWFTKNKDNKVTGSTLWGFFRMMIIRACRSDKDIDLETVKVRKLVVCVDDCALVPKQKAAEQARRRRQREEGYKKSEEVKKEPLKFDPDVYDAVFSDFGLSISSKDGKDTLMSKTMIDLDVLRMTYTLRKPLMQYFKKKFIQWTTQGNMPVTLDEVIFDYDGIELFNWTRTEDPDPNDTGRTVSIRERLGYDVPVWGEADLKILTWARHFGNTHHVAIETIDSDVFPTCCRLVSKMKGHLYWVNAVNWGKQTPLCVDLTQHIQHMFNGPMTSEKQISAKTARRRLGPEGFVCLCVCCGTDFFDKQTMLAYFKVDEIVTAIYKSLDEIKAIPVAIDRAFQTANGIRPHELSACVAAIKAIISHLDYGKDASNKNKHKPRTDADFQRVAAALFWNLNYWSYQYDSVRLYGAAEEQKAMEPQEEVRNDDEAYETESTESPVSSDEADMSEPDPAPPNQEAIETTQERETRFAQNRRIAEANANRRHRREEQAQRASRNQKRRRFARLTDADEEFFLSGIERYSNKKQK